MTAKQKLQTYEITKILRPSKQNTSNSNYNVFLKLDKTITFGGFTSCEPYLYDLLECELYKNQDTKSDSNIYTGKNVSLKLPENPQHQKFRILQLLSSNSQEKKISNNDYSDNSDYSDYSDIESNENDKMDKNNENNENNENTDDEQNISIYNKVFKKINYGKNFWFSIYKYYLESQNVEGCKIDKSLDIICKHISNYHYSIINHFIESLSELGIKLKIVQYYQLYLHPKFGYDINNWNGDNLCELFKMNGFGIKTILLIGDGIKISIEQRTKLIILYQLNYNLNGNSYISYDYNEWINWVFGYENTDHLIEYLTEDNFNQIINKMIMENLIIKIDKYLFGNDIYQTEMNIAQHLINIKNRKYKLIDKIQMENQLVQN